MHHNYFVYTHTRSDTNEVFYVGIGKSPSANKIKGFKTKYSRAYEKTKRHSFWKNIIKKTDYKVNIVYETSDEKAVKLKEIELISFYGRRCCDASGTLVNFDTGGSSNKGPKSRGVKINQLDKTNKKIIKIWNELKDIQNELGFLKTNIVKCCRKKQLTAYGYMWEYHDDKNFNNIYATAARSTKNSKNRIGIIATNKKTLEELLFRDQNSCAKYFELHRSTIHHYLHGESNHKLYNFRYRTKDELLSSLVKVIN